MAQHGTRYGERRELLRDRILAMKALWTQDEASYDGELVHDRAELGVAEAGTATAPADRARRRRRAEDRQGRRRVLRRLDADRRAQLKSGWDEVRRACDDIGRDPQTVELGVFNAPPDEAKLTELAGFGL